MGKEQATWVTRQAVHFGLTFVAKTVSLPVLEALSAVVFSRDFRMIVKPYEQTAVHTDPRQRAGAAAEEQMAHYLNRSFSGDERVFVLHGLRLEDRDHPEQAEFLAAQHAGQPLAPSAPTNENAPNRNRQSPRNRAAGAECSAKAACKYCGSRNLTARSGQYGYYWKCGACDKNTAMPAVCSACGAKKGRDNGVRVCKSKNTYFRDCEKCATSEPIWVED